MVIVGLMVLNLVIAVILENFSSLGNLRDDLVSAYDLDSFKEVWALTDTDTND